MKISRIKVSLMFVLACSGVIWSSLSNAAEKSDSTAKVTCPCEFDKGKFKTEMDNLSKSGPINSVCQLEEKDGTKITGVAVADQQNHSYDYTVAWNPANNSGACVIMADEVTKTIQKYTDPAVSQACGEYISNMAKDLGIECKNKQ